LVDFVRVDEYVFSIQEWGKFWVCPVKKANKMQNSAKTDPAYDQISLRAILNRQDEVYQEQLLSFEYWENWTLRRKLGGNFD
jgi:hypothetical protein